ncbi:MAG: hypothetical protein IJB79_01125 [Candidatus Gastranaerophilales bacterium]|nr:hypothetical protein [Candidatus Gastranaerophilales bacterium]
MINKKIDKIIITGQALRKNWTSFGWFYELFCYYIEKATGLKCYCTVSPEKKEEFYPEDKYIPYDIKKIYNAYGFDYSSEGVMLDIAKQWCEIYYNNEYNKVAYDYFYSIFKDSLVISFEIEDIVKTALSYFEIPHIDINLCPIRFLSDVMLCFKTDIKEVYDKFLKYRVDEEKLYLEANYIKSIYTQFGQPDGNDVLFLGQTGLDKTLINPKTKEIYSILEHIEEFKSTLSGFDRIFYKPHPRAYERLEVKVIRHMKTLADVEIINTNFYELISSKNIKKVVSISSGTCAEAKYFGKETQTLLQVGVPRQTKDEFDKDKYVSIYGSFFSLNFWSDILSPLIETKKFDRLITIEERNKLRNSRPNALFYYAWQNLDTINLEKKIRHSLIAYDSLEDIF